MRKEELRIIRRSKDKSQEELSEQTGLSIKTISNYERDINSLRSASYSNLQKIANALDVSIDDIFLG